MPLSLREKGPHPWRMLAPEMIRDPKLGWRYPYFAFQ
jgi:hypothetical protein